MKLSHIISIIFLLLFLAPFIVFRSISILIAFGIIISFPATAYWLSKIIIKILEKTNLRFRHYVLFSIVISVIITIVMILTIPGIIFVVIGLICISAIIGTFLRPSIKYY